MMTKFFAKRSEGDDQYVIGLNRVKNAVGEELSQAAPHAESGSRLT